jgi:hypothetical protein
MTENNSLTIMPTKKSLVDVKDILSQITNKHSEVSSVETPKAYIKKKMGYDYVEIKYMRKLADKHFPGWSWTIVNTEVLGSEAYVVHGKLKWFDNGIWREGDMVAAHRIQKLKEDPSRFADIGNDIKSANTDTMKKAFNMYMNIADDVYRNEFEDADLTDEQYKSILKLAKKIDLDMELDIAKKIDSGDIHGLNYKAATAKLERLAKGK